MKKIKLDGKLSLKKETIAKLNNIEMSGINGGKKCSCDPDANSTPQNPQTCDSPANTCVYVDDGCPIIEG